MVEKSFDKLVGHLLIDSMSLVTHEVPQLLVPSSKILQIWPVQIVQNRYLRLLQIYFLSNVAASNCWLVNLGPWLNVHRIHFTVSVGFNVFFFGRRIKILCLQCSWKLVWNNWIGPHAWSYHHAVKLDRLDCSQCFTDKKLKI